MFWVAGRGGGGTFKNVGLLSLFLLHHRKTTVACGWSRFPRFSGFWIKSPVKSDNEFSKFEKVDLRFPRTSTVRQ
jgi:hypothetical protein